ncbi:MAG: hypothetical protein AAFV53_24785 [Myxococcota bacterium]
MKTWFFPLILIGVGGCSEYHLDMVATTELLSPLDERFADVLGGDTPRADAPIYINEASTLWAWYPQRGELDRIGDFTSPAIEMTGMTDIAIDKGGRMVGCTPLALYAIDPTTAETAELTTLDRQGDLIGLTFLEDGTLIGGASDLRVLDLDTGATLETLNDSFITSGDVVALPDGKLYWSVQGDFDDIVTYDIQSDQSGLFARGAGQQIFGIAYADETLYGFTGTGAVLTLNHTDGEAFPNNMDGGWYGAATNPVRWSD